MHSVEQTRLSTDRTGTGSAGWIERARPLLGTLVRIGVGGLEPSTAHAAIDRAFGTIEMIHALMSFHEPQSDVSRLNRDASSSHVSVNPHTVEVLRLSIEVAAASAGVFDVTVAPLLVEAGFLPTPGAAPRPHPDADWRDIDLGRGGVRFGRPLWVDLGGIAKGYAVDAALEAMQLPQNTPVCVDAGGDLRVAGPWPRRIILNAPDQRRDALPTIELTDGAVASSSGFVARVRHGDYWRGMHIHGRERAAAPPERFASVVAPRCAIADALTKVALFAPTGDECRTALTQFRASAHVFSRVGGWETLGHAA